MRARHIIRAVAIAVAASFLYASGPVVAAPTKQGAIDIFYQGTGSFMSRKAQGGEGYNWSDDGCSVPTVVKIVAVTTAFASQIFVDQCKQHDFGYRNFGGSLRLDPTESRRRSVDDHFYGRMNARCGAWWIRYSGGELACLGHSLVFYTAVRNFGRF
jgi:hypothetical protein